MARRTASLLRQSCCYCRFVVVVDRQVLVPVLLLSINVLNKVFIFTGNNINNSTVSWKVDRSKTLKAREDEDEDAGLDDEDNNDDENEKGT
jgi:hypothetical protein